MLQLYDIEMAKADHLERVKNADSIKAEIDKVLAAVEDSNAILQVNTNMHIYFRYMTVDFIFHSSCLLFII